MAHLQQKTFVQSVVSNFETDFIEQCSVLEIGAYDVNGSIRGIIPAKKYIGLDLVSGPGVDIVYDGIHFSRELSDFCISISCECFEHNPFWDKSLQSMIERTSKGGIVIFTCASRGRVEHGTSRTDPSISPGTSDSGIDYYKNLHEEDFRSRFDFDDIFSDYFFLFHKKSHDLYFYGQIKGRGVDHFRPNARKIKERALVDILNAEKETKSPNFFRVVLDTIDYPIRTMLINFPNDDLYQRYMIFKLKNLRKLREFFRGRL